MRLLPLRYPSTAQKAYRPLALHTRLPTVTFTTIRNMSSSVYATIQVPNLGEVKIPTGLFM
jgi:hypothetical protein